MATMRLKGPSPNGGAGDCTHPGRSHCTSHVNLILMLFPTLSACVTPRLGNRISGVKHDF